MLQPNQNVMRSGGTPDVAAIERAEPSRYRALVEPELRGPPPLQRVISAKLSWSI